MKKLELKTTLPKISSNFGVIKLQLLEELKSYELVVGQDDIKTAKSMATKINKIRSEIDTLRKEKVKELSAPIKDFDEKAKELASICQTSRQKLLEQVKVFEDKEKERALELLSEYKCEIEKKYNIKEGFEIKTPFDLAILSNLTKTGLSKKARDEIEKRVLSKKAFQDKIEKRLLSLEGFCLKNGLEVSFTQNHINHFLMVENDTEYETKLLSLIKSELQRQEATKRKAEEQINKREAEKKLVEKQSATVTQKPAEKVIIKTVSKTKVSSTDPYSRVKRNAALFAPSSKKKYLVTATFEVEVDEKISAGLSKALLNKFAKAGFKVTPSITVEEIVALAS